jgi:hypothetical protein
VPISNFAPSCPPRDRPPVRATARMGGQTARDSALAGGHARLKAQRHACRRVRGRRPCRGIVGVRRSLQPPMPYCRRAGARRLSSQPRCRAARRTVPISNLAPPVPHRDRPPVRAKARMGGQTARDSALAGGHTRLKAQRHACRRVRGPPPCRGIVGVRRSLQPPMPSCRRAGARRLSSQPRCRAARRTVPISNLAPPVPSGDRPPVRAKARMGGQAARDSALAGGHTRLRARRHACRRVRRCGIGSVRRSLQPPMPSCRRADARRLSSQPRYRAARRTVPISNLAPPVPPRDRPPVRASPAKGRYGPALRN